MTKTLLKNTFREIRNTKARFISIMAIIALGVGFFAGIKATAPSMNKMAENYYNDTNLMDFRLVSTVGFDEDDINEVQKTEGVSDLMPSYFTDVIVNTGESGSPVRIISVPEKYKNNNILNELTLLEGRMPEKTGEILIEKGNFGGDSLNIGYKVNIEKEAGDTDVNEILNKLEYTVVGIVESPLYISYERGITTIGNGKLSSFMYVLPEDFKVEKYTELYVKTEYSNSNISPFSDEYKNSIEEVKANLENTADHRVSVFNTDVIGKAQKEIDNGWKNYNKEKKNADKELKNSKNQLDNAQKEYDKSISDAQKQLDDAQNEITSGEIELNDSLEEYNKQISEGEKQLEESENQLNFAKAEYEKSRAEFKEKINSAQQKIDQGLESYTESYNNYYDTVKPNLIYQLSQAQSGLQSINENIANLKEQLTYLEASTADEANKINLIKAQLSDLYSQKAVLESSVDEINNTIVSSEGQLEYTKTQIEYSQAQLNTQKAEGEIKLSEALLQIEQGEAEFNSGKDNLESAKAQGSAELAAAEEKLSQAKAELEKAREEFDSESTSGKQKLDDGYNEYNKALKTANEKLNKAKEDLEKAQKELSEISEAKWYVFTRDDNPGYSDFTSNTNRVDAVAAVFPTFFLLVAVLVCLTTMTRLIEEKRTEIGTLKALGYSGRSIVCKFLIYSTIAGIIGSVAGILIGVNTLPYIIYNAYKMMYHMADLPLVIDWFSVIAGFIAALLCTSTVSAVICVKTLKHKPASLMRPKAPKPGKRILLEKIPPIWKHFGFTSKVTARNLFRYKSRLFMTVLGVAGCTALIVAAFGLLDSFSVITDKQFTDIYKYDATIVPKDEGTAKDIENLTKYISDDKNITDYFLARQSAITVKTKKAVKEKSTYVFVPENIDSFKSLLSLHTRTGQTPLELGNDGVIVTEKMASELGITVGSEITVIFDDKEVSLSVSGICENYIYNYVYITPQLYSKKFDNKIEFNSIFISIAEGVSDDTIGQNYLDRDDVSAVSFASSGVNDFQRMLNSMNMVVLVMIICAGALAFVVLYNLTNINMEERVREIATIKVLGFYNRETAQYIYRENIVLSILGIIAGLFLGIILTGFVVTTVEVDNVMFGREIFFTTYLYAAGLTALFSGFVNIFMYFKMKKIDMVESLKSIE